MAPTFNLNHVTKDYPFMTCLVKVNNQSSWQKTVGKVLNKCHGVYSFRMDNSGVVEISGTVDPTVLLKMLGKAGRKAELLWFQFGECSSNLFMPVNHHSGYYGEGTSYARDGRYLHSANLPRPKLLSQEALRSSSPYDQKQDCQILYDHQHDYRPYAQYHNLHSYYDQKHNYQHGNDYQYSSSTNPASQDISCCMVM